MSCVFYLNDLLPISTPTNVDMQEIFESTMTWYVQLKKEPLLDIKEYIVLSSEAKNISLCGVPLSTLLKDIKDRDLKAACFNYFTRYDNISLIDNNYDAKTIDDAVLGEILDLKYHNGISATNAAISSIKSWILLSFPIEKEWKQSVICLDDSNRYKLVNFYGANRYDVIDKIFKDKKKGEEETVEELFLRFKHRLNTYKIQCSASFKTNLLMMKKDEISHMIKRLYTACSKNLISACREEDALYRKCKGIECSTMFELKSAHNLGIRFYLKKKDNVLIFGGLGKKSDYKGNKQSNDIKRAYDEIVKIENSINSSL